MASDINLNFKFCVQCAHLCGEIMMLKFLSWFVKKYACVCLCINIHPFSLIHSLKESPVEVTTTNDHGKQYSDGKWHEIIAIRYQTFGNITLDGQYIGKYF